MLVRRGHDDLPQGLRSLDGLQRREAVLVFTTCLTEHLKRFGRRDDPPEGGDLHRLDLGDAVEAEVLEPVPRPCLQGRQSTECIRGQEVCLLARLDHPHLVLGLGRQSGGGEALA